MISEIFGCKYESKAQKEGPYRKSLQFVILSENYPVPVKRIGVNDEFGHSGPAAALLKAFGLCADNIVATTKAFLGK